MAGPGTTLLVTAQHAYVVDWCFLFSFSMLTVLQCTGNYLPNSCTCIVDANGGGSGACTVAGLSGYRAVLQLHAKLVKLMKLRSRIYLTYRDVFQSSLNMQAMQKRALNKSHANKLDDILSHSHSASASGVASDP